MLTVGTPRYLLIGTFDPIHMRVGLVVAPFVSVPPRGYGGTELFVAGLAEGLSKLGHDVLVYTNGESTIAAEQRWIYPH